jgi:hypothetical protein
MAADANQRGTTYHELTIGPLDFHDLHPQTTHAKNLYRSSINNSITIPIPSKYLPISQPRIRGF